MTVVTGKRFIPGLCPHCSKEMDFRFYGEFECRSGDEILEALEAL
jgi:Zn ribbon nucleic-acid-binding protein